ncbi:MAG: putative ribosome quality control (RQC) complex YloA/Tae2 family protein [Arenicella sp.]
MLSLRIPHHRDLASLFLRTKFNAYLYRLGSDYICFFWRSLNILRKLPHQQILKSTNQFMHNSYYYIRKLSKALEKELVGLELGDCFSQNKDELVLGFCAPDKEFWMKASLQPDMCMLIFPKDFARAKKNSVDLFLPLFGCKVLAVRQFKNERAFGIELENNYRLVFKMYGNRANVVLFEGEKAQKLFRKRFEKDAESNYSELDREIQQDFEYFKENGLQQTFPTFDKTTKKWLESEYDFSNQTVEKQWESIEELVSYLENPDFYVCSKGNLPKLSLFPQDEVLEKMRSPIEAGNDFFYRFSKVYFTERHKQKIAKSLNSQIKKSENYIKKNQKKLNELQHSSRFEETANIIMANLHQIPKYAEEVELFDFYNEKNIKIKLNKEHTPQKVAEKYYRKSKNQKKEIAKLQQNIDKKEAEIFKLATHLEAIEPLTTYKELTKYQKAHKLKAEETVQEVSLPYKKFTFMDFDILVGKNSKSNDKLTQKHTYKEDLWLHARDVTGSHVVLKYQAGKPFPPIVIEKAASLAAFYSQGKSNSLQPVICTPKKYVRKTKNMLPGQVIVDKEEKVLMVEPKSFDEEVIL